MNKFLNIKSIALLFTAVAMIIALFFFLALKPSPLNIVSVEPKDKATNQSLVPNISVSFSRQVSSSEQKGIFIEEMPILDGSVSWSADKKTMDFIPSSPLLPSSSYKITLSSDSLSKSWSFTTVSEDNLSAQDEEAIQGQLDADTAISAQEFLNNHPWYEKLPLITNAYFVGYDSNKENFFVYLYPTSSSSASIDSQVVGLKTQVMAALKNIGANPNPATVEWNISPK